MQDILGTVDRWIAEKKKIAVATVIKTWGSSPQSVGAKMVISDTREFIGSVSGGCVEGAVIAKAYEVIKKQRSELLHFGVADKTAWGVGLACGGEIDVYLEPVDDEGVALYQRVKGYFDSQKAFITARVIRGPEEEIGRYLLLAEGSEPIGTMNKVLWDQVAAQASVSLNRNLCLSEEYSLGEKSVEVFFEFQGPALKLIIVGGVHISIALATQAKSLGYKVYIVDPRTSFGTEKRFPDVDSITTEWPDQALVELGLDRSTAVVVLTHDPKLDDPALKAALPSEAFYIGALGSRTTQRLRHQRLRESGISEEQLGRLRGPIGLNLGGQKPEEIALSVMAEIIAVRSHSPLAMENKTS